MYFDHNVMSIKYYVHIFICSYVMTGTKLNQKLRTERYVESVQIFSPRS